MSEIIAVNASKHVIPTPIRTLNLNIELGRFLAITCVIVIHMSMGYFNNPALIGTLDWYISNLFYSLTRFCVPFFLIISSYIYIIDQSQLQKPLLSKYKRLLVPFLFWSLAYYFYAGYPQEKKGVVNFISVFLTSGTSFHLWFFYSFLMYLLTIPIFIIAYDKINKKNYNFIFIVLFTIVIVIPSICNYLQIDNGIIPSFDSNKIKPDFIIYSLATPLIIDVTKKTRSSTLIIVFFASCIVNFTLVAIISTNLNRSFETAYSYTNALVFISAYALFIWLTRLKQPPRLKVERITIISGRSSFGIYLSHWMVYITLDNLGLFLHASAGISIIYDSILLLISTTLLVQIFMRIPYLRKVV